MTKACTVFEPSLTFESTARWKRVGVAWSAVCLNFSLWGAVLWGAGLVG